MQKPPKKKTKKNRLFGKNLQRFRISNGIFEQEILANALGWGESKVRDREIGVASISFDDINRMAYAFDMKPVDLAHELIAPFCIAKNRTVVVYFSELEDWMVEMAAMWTSRKRSYLSKKTWALALLENLHGEYRPYDDFEDAVLYFEDTMYDLRRELKTLVDNKTKKVTALRDATVLGEDFTKGAMKKPGQNLKGARLRQGDSAQWKSALDIGYNASWWQAREAGSVCLKLEEAVIMAETWKINPFDLIDQLFAEEPPTNDELKLLRKQFC